MKSLKNLEINTSSSSVEIFNSLEDETPTSFDEALRTIEAIECVRNNVPIVERIREEVSYDESTAQKELKRD